MRWFTEAGLVIETAGGSRVALVAASVVFLAVALWRLWRGALPVGRGMLVCAAACGAAWLGGAWLGPWLFGAPGYSSLVGASAGVLVGLSLARAVALRPAALADAAAPAALLALGVSRLGCLFQGCDFGRPAGHALPWGVRHVEGTRAFAWQRRHELLGPFARLSEPVHPIALYEALPVLVAGLVLLRVRGGGEGRLAAVAALVYLLARLVAELYRADPLRVAGAPLAVWLGLAALGCAAALLRRGVRARRERGAC